MVRLGVETTSKALRRLARRDGPDAGRVARALSRLTAAAPDPSDSRTKTMMAFMYLRLNRYQEAIRPLEDVLAGAVGEKNLSFVLALAYVGAGDEGNAVRVLRWTAGLPEDRVRTEVETLGREVRRRGPRR